MRTLTEIIGNLRSLASRALPAALFAVPDSCLSTQKPEALITNRRLCGAIGTIARIDLWLSDFLGKNRHKPTRFIDTMPAALLSSPWGCLISASDGRHLGYLRADCSIVDIAFRLQAPLRTSSHGDYYIQLWEDATTQEYFSRLATLMLLEYTEAEKGAK